MTTYCNVGSWIGFRTENWWLNKIYILPKNIVPMFLIVWFWKLYCTYGRCSYQGKLGKQYAETFCTIFTTLKLFQNSFLQKKNRFLVCQILNPTKYQNMAKDVLWVIIVAVQWLSHVWLFETPQTAAYQASLSCTLSQNLLKLKSIESVMPSNPLILCRSLLLPPSIFHSVRVFSNESVLHIRWPM